jgi:hypothetical protein
MRRAALVAALVALLAGCTVTAQDVGATAQCSHTHGHPYNPVLLIAAQAVPTAELIPCVRLIPVGWKLGNPDVHNGRAEFSLASDRDGPHAVTVYLTKSCDISGATAVPSDHPGTKRYEQPVRVSSGYAGDRYYVYPGGCTTYRFNLHGPNHAEPVNDASLALDFVTRDSLMSALKEESHGRLKLNPPALGSPR